MESDKTEKTSGTPAEEKTEPQQEKQQLSRLNSITTTVSDVTEKTKKYISSMKEQAIPQKLPTQINKKTLDGFMIDERLTTSEGLIFKAKMIGSLSVQFHHGDMMAIAAIRDLKTFAKTSGRHKARIFLKISTSGIQIFEDGSMKSIDKHDLDKISYLTQDVDDKKVFAYVYNKQILNKEKGTSSIAHRLFAIKSPKCGVIVTHMKAVFHYMFEMKKSKNKVNTKNVDMSKIREAALKPPEEEEPTYANQGDVVHFEDEATTGFGYGKLVDLVDTEAVAIKSEVRVQAPEAAELPGASNLYSTMPSGNKLQLDDTEQENEPVYSTVRKIRSQPLKDAVVKDEVGMLNPTWNRSETTSMQDDDPFSLDTFQERFRKDSSSDSSDDDETTFTIPVIPTQVPSSVFVDDYEWDVQGDRPKRLYSDAGHFELTDSRERLSTITKKAVESLERSRSTEKAAETKKAEASLIDFATFEDRLETSDPIDLFDTLTVEKNQQNNSITNDLFSLNLDTHSTDQPKSSMTNTDTKRYEIDLNSLITDPNTYNQRSKGTPNFVATPASSAPVNNFKTSPQLGTSTSFGAFGGAGAGNAPNYQPNYTFPVQFNATQMQQPTVPQSTKNPFSNQPKTQSTTNSSGSFDPFGDLVHLNDVI